MALFDWLFGGDGDTQTNTTVSANQLPAWLQGAAQENIRRADQITARPYEPYPEARIAPFTSDQQSGFDLTRANTGAWQPGMTGAMDTTSGVMNQPGMAPTQMFAGDIPGYVSAYGRYNPTAGAAMSSAQGIMNQDFSNPSQMFPDANMAQYMNPYTQAVTDEAVRETQRTGEQQRNRIGQAAAGSGVYGGSRHGVVEAEQMRNENRLVGDMRNRGLDMAWQQGMRQFNQDNANRQRDEALRQAMTNQRLAAGGQAAQLGGQGFQYGLNQYNTDQSRLRQDESLRQAQDAQRLGAAGQYASMGDLASSLGLRDANALGSIGGQQQQLGQASYDTAYQDFLRQWQYPQEMLNLRTSTVAGQPYSTSKTTTTTGPGPNTTAQNVTAAAALAGMAGKFFG
jgi:hypothetical protein